MKRKLEDVIRATATLARLRLPEAELTRYTEKAQIILTYVAQLDKLDTGATPPQSHAFENRFSGRDDVVHREENANAITELFPERAGRLIRVPKVIDS